MIETHTKLFIDGTWAKPATTATIEVISPHTEEVIAKVPEARDADVDRAVAAARAAFDHGPWPRMPPAERADAMAAALGGAAGAQRARWRTHHHRRDGLARSRSRTWARCSPRPWCSTTSRASPASTRSRRCRQGMLGPRSCGASRSASSAAIMPWNVPLFTVMLKLGPAARRGLHGGAEAGARDAARRRAPRRGVEEAGSRPASSTSCRPAARSASTSCATPTSTRSASPAAPRPAATSRRSAASSSSACTLELGGKSAAIILDDADLDSDHRRPAAGHDHEQRPGLRRADPHPRLAQRYDEVADALAAALGAAAGRRSRSTRRRCAARWSSQRQRDRVEGYIGNGRDEGARVAVGGGRPAGSTTAGTSSRRSSPTSTTRCASRRRRSSARCSRSSPTRTRTTRVRIANDSDYGLSGSVWTADVDRGVDVARRVRTGTYTVNSFMMDFSAPVRRLQVLRHRPRARPRGPRGVPRGEDHQPADGLRAEDEVLEDYSPQRRGDAETRVRDSTSVRVLCVSASLR